MAFGLAHKADVLRRVGAVSALVAELATVEALLPLLGALHPVLLHVVRPARAPLLVPLRAAAHLLPLAAVHLLRHVEPVGGRLSQLVRRGARDVVGLDLVGLLVVLNLIWLRIFNCMMVCPRFSAFI